MDVKQLKDELMEPDWTESLHMKLDELDTSVAAEIVESMDSGEIYQKINHRQYQNDYIADYIDFIWDISEDAYWRHIQVSLDYKVGFLWSDNMSHAEKMCGHKVPTPVLHALLNLIVLSNDPLNLEPMAEIIKSQVQEHSGMPDIENYISTLEESQSKLLLSKIKTMLASESVYDFK
ncbi:hypothetical protein JHW46_05000 [Vibrio splendidus]|nr:hypothetical protein [Vibrio splendidus]